MEGTRLTADDDAEIRNLLARYCLFLDLEDLDGWVELFTIDCRFHVYGHTFEGRDGLRRMVDGAPGGLHLGGPPVVEPVGSDRATSKQNLLFIDRRSGDQRAAVYEDELERTTEGWRIASRRCRFMVPDGLADRPVA
jgi:3-phenylpropionate/cinnamic acid dioxygenase small subunit